MDILKIDMDYHFEDFGISKKQYESVIKNILKTFNIKAKEFTYRTSSSGRGKHVWIFVDRKLSDRQKVALQLLCYDDPVRGEINLKRIERGFVKWNKLFSKVLYKRKQPLHKILWYKIKRFWAIYGW